MNNLGKRFMALFIAFVSIISYIPLQLVMGGQAANAATSYNIPEQYLKVQVNDSSKKTLPEGIDELDGYPYFDSSQGGSYFDITIKDYTEDIDKKLETIKNNATDNVEGEITSITGLNIVATSLNNIDLTKASGETALQELGITIKDTPTNTITGRSGIRIENPPLGVDKVQYRIEGTVTRTKYKVTVSDNGRKTLERVSDTIDDEKYIAKNEENIIINNGTDFVGNNVKLTFEQYIGTGNTSETNLDDFLDSESSKYNNKAPFLYTAEAESDEKVKLRYTWGVPDSLSALYYKMRFKGVELGHSDTIVYVNGQKGNATNTSNDTIKGYLGSISSKDQFVVIKINGTENNTSMTKLYSAELRYSQKNRENDYSIQEAGIYKADYAEDPEVKAYIGKRFTEKIVKDDDGNLYSEYKGTITIDPKARMINLTPKLVRNANTVRYELWNNYTKDGISKSIKAYELINGKAYVDFNIGEENQLELQVYDTASGNLLAKYKLDVIIREDAEKGFKPNFIFDDDNENTFLTREGAGKDTSKKITFAQGLESNRSTFDLYTKEKGQVKISLDEDSRTRSKEYFKVWKSDNTEGNDFEETSESIENVFDIRTGERSTDLYVNFGNAKRIMIQAYRDQVSEENGEFTLIKSYPVREKFIFFIPDNIDSSSGDNTGKSDNATLSNIKVKGETLYNLDTDKNGFSSDSYNYKVTVPKGTESAVITITAEDDNVKSISAAVSGTDIAYDITSGEQTELMLNSSGITDLEITVTAQDGKTVKVYNLSIINNTKGGASKLKDLILSEGDFKFDPDEDITKVQVEQKINKIYVTPVAEDLKAKVTVDGQKYAGKPIEVSLRGQQTTEIEIEVESEDGKNTTTYILKIKRVSSFDNSSDENTGLTEDIYYDYDNDCWVDTTKYDEWGTIKGKVMYFDKKGRQVKSRWIRTNNKWYYINESGYRATGWKVDIETGQRYYMDNITGEMKTGWMYVNGSWYYLGTTGIMHTGWLWLNNNWYYFTQNGEMIVNQTMQIDGKVYRFATDGRIY